MPSEAIDIFAMTMNTLLQERSFRKRNLNWIQETPYVYKVINIQKSQWGRQVYLNWAIFIRALTDRTRALRNFINSNPFGFLTLQGRKSELVKLIDESGTHDVLLKAREYLELT